MNKKIPTLLKKINQLYGGLEKNPAKKALVNYLTSPVSKVPTN
jgi:hypothetical protein